MLDQVLQRAREQRARAEAELFQLIGIPSISALPEYREDCRRAAGWLARKLHSMGMEVQLSPAPEGGHPVVMAEWLGRPGAPTVTIYGHYDVQPPDPLAEWLSPPFEPALRDGYVYARGADDNKGQHVAAIKAVEYWFQCGGPPVNVRFLVEGEEEISGRTLPDYVHANAAHLGTDYLLIIDGQFVAAGVPAIVTGLRGLLYTEIEVTGPRVDLHSGIFGGLAPNPFHSLAHILAGLKDREGRIQIPGFYDDVEPPTPEEMDAWAGLPITEEQVRDAIGADLVGEPDRSLLERKWARPTLDVHGVMGGFTGEGTKTVIPASARAKVSMRLAPNQDPQAALAALREAVANLVTPGTQAKVIEITSARPVRMPADHAGVEAVRRAFQAAFEASPVLVREGGSVPVAIDFQEALPKGKLVVTGLGLPGDGLHSPNERMSLDQFHRGTEMVVHLMHELAVAAGIEVTVAEAAPQGEGPEEPGAGRAAQAFGQPDAGHVEQAAHDAGADHPGQRSPETEEVDPAEQGADQPDAADAARQAGAGSG